MVSLTNGAARLVLVLACWAASAVAEDELHTMRVGVVVYEGVEMLDFSGPVEVFAAAGNDLSLSGRPLFEVVTVAPSKGLIRAHGGVAIEPRFSIAERPRLDVVVIPGGETKALDEDPAFLDWLRETAPRATIVMSVCNGAFVLAKVGLLDGCEATTYHGFLGFLKSDAPRTKVLSGRRVVDNGHIVTAGGVACGIDGALHLVARLYGRRLAESIAGYMEYPWTPEPVLSSSYSEWAPSGDERLPLRQQLRWQRGKGDPAAIERITRALTDVDPDDATAWYELGAALLAQRRFDDAIAASEESAKLPGRRPVALYNVACAWARKGEPDRALEALGRAVAAGWSDRARTERDLDLASLRGDPRFAAVLDRIAAQGTVGGPEWVEAILVRAREMNESGCIDDTLQMLANGVGQAPGSDALRAALEQALARCGDEPRETASQARLVLELHPQRSPVVPTFVLGGDRPPR